MAEIIYRKLGVKILDKQFRKCFLSAVVLTVIIATTVVFHYIKSPLINLSKGKRFFKQGKNLTAIAYFNLASAAEPRNKEPLLYLAFAYDKLGRSKDIIKTLEAANKIDGKDLEILIAAYSDTFTMVKMSLQMLKNYIGKFCRLNMTPIYKCDWPKFRLGRKNTVKP